MRLSFLYVFILFSSAFQAHGLVDMRNANYSDTWIDLEVPGVGYDLKIERTYNSRSLYNGIFGFGWCSDFETSLEITGDGTLKVTECGSGFESVYLPKGFNPANTGDAVEKIVAKVRAVKTAAKENYFKDLRQALLQDRRLRDKYARELGITPKMENAKIFLANGKGPDTIELENSEYVRKLGGGSIQRFNEAGQMTSMYDKNNNHLKFSYSEGLLQSVTDNNGRKLTFQYFPNKKIKKITGPNSLASEYKFSNLNDLSWNKNAWNNEYTYKYDELHNLTGIAFPDKSTKTLTYDSNMDWVTSFKDRNNCTENYKYEFSKDDPKNHYWSTVTKKCGDKLTNNSRYEFWYKLNRNKTDKYLSRVATKINNVTTDITYHDLFAKPVEVVTNGRVSKFDYDDNTGLLKSKSEGTRKLFYGYDDKCSKVANVTEGKIKTNFQYDTRCNLVKAENTRGQTVAITYDPQGRIATMVDQARRTINIKYEEKFGKPNFLERPGLGSIKVSYKPTGEIKNVDSPNGPVVAAQVASAFNNLLDVIEPAGIELGL